MPTPAEAFEHLVPWVRAQFPQIECLRNGQRRVYLDNAAGTLVPSTVADAMREAALWANPQPGRSWPAGPETLAEHRRVRALLGDFLNARGEDRVYFAESTTAALYKLREALEPGLEGGSVVVTDCDHFANISAWEWRARWEVRRARMAADGSLDLDRFAALLAPDTRIAAVTLASNGLGTVLSVPEIARLVRERAPQAWLVVDAVHAAPHLPIDVAALGADAVAFSTYKLFGPNAGVLWLRSDRAPADAFHVEPHTDAETLLEWGTLSNVTVAGVRAALEYLQRLGERLEPAFVGALREYPRERRRFKLALTAIRDCEAETSGQILDGVKELQAAGRLLSYGIWDPARARERVPTFAFEVPGLSDADVERRLWEAEFLQVAAGNHYSAAVLRGLQRPSVVRASFAHYNDRQEVNHFLRGLRALAAG